MNKKSLPALKGDLPLVEYSWACPVDLVMFLNPAMAALIEEALERTKDAYYKYSTKAFDGAGGYTVVIPEILSDTFDTLIPLILSLSDPSA